MRAREVERAARAERADVERLERHREVLGRARRAREVQHAVDRARRPGCSSLTSADDSVKPGRSSEVARRCRAGPVERLSTATTSSPRSSKRSAEVRPDEPGAAGDDDAAHRRPTPVVGEPAPAHRRRVEQVAGVDDARAARIASRTRSKSSQRNSSHSVSSATHVGARRRVVRVGARRRARASSAGALLARGRVVRRARSRPASSSRRAITSAGESRRSSVSALNVRPHTAIVAPASEPPAARAHLLDDALVLRRVHLDDAVEQLEVVARVARGVQQRGDVLREARAAVARTRVQELEPDARVVAHADRDLADVGVDRLAQVRDRVDERDLGGEERVRRVLDHLGRRRVGDEHRRVHAAVELARRAPPTRGSSQPITTRSGCRKSRTAWPSRRNSGFDATPTSLVRRARLGEHALHEPRRADRHRRLVDDDRARARAPARSRARRPRRRRGRPRRRRPAASARRGTRSRRRAAAVGRADDERAAAATRAPRRRARAGPSSRIGTSPLLRRATRSSSMSAQTTS